MKLFNAFPRAALNVMRVIFAVFMFAVIFAPVLLLGSSLDLAADWYQRIRRRAAERQ